MRDTLNNIESNFKNGFKAEIKEAIQGANTGINKKLTVISFGFLGVIGIIGTLVGIIIKLLP